MTEQVLITIKVEAAGDSSELKCSFISSLAESSYLIPGMLGGTDLRYLMTTLEERVKELLPDHHIGGRDSDGLKSDL